MFDWSKPSFFICEDDLEDSTSYDKIYDDDDDDETDPLAYLNYYNTYEENE